MKQVATPHRAAAYGFRLHIPAPARRCASSPASASACVCVALAGERIVYGGNGLIAGKLDDAGEKQQALEKLEKFDRNYERR